MAAGAGSGGPDLVATADRLGVAGVWPGGLALALVWNGLTGRLVAIVPGRDGDEVLGPAVALCFCAAPARLGHGSRGGAVGVVAVTCDGAAGFSVRVYSAPTEGAERAGSAGGDTVDGAAVASLCWVGWGRCKMVRAVAATGGGEGPGDELLLVTAGRRHVR